QQGRGVPKPLNSHDAAYEQLNTVNFVRFTHRGRNYRLDPQTVQRLLRGVEPEATRLWWVEVNGVRYPVNQAFEVASGIHRSTYSTDLPQRTLRRLGFPV